MIIRWTAEAAEDLSVLRAYITQTNLGSAAAITLRVVAAVAKLSENQSLGRAGRIPGTRELVIPKTTFIVPYRVVENTVQILRVYHTARPWPDRL